jgi:hypothetical protein
MTSSIAEKSVMKTRHEEIKQAVRLGVRKIRESHIEGDLATVLAQRMRIISSLVEFVVSDVTETSLSVAIIETFNEIDTERNARERIAQFCEERLVREGEEGIKSSNLNLWPPI